MKLSEIIKFPEVGYRVAEENLNLVKEGNDFDRDKNCCCDNPDLTFLKAPAWEVAKYCSNCDSLIIIFPQDRMGGSWQDPWQIFKDATSENPLLSFKEHNHFMDFCSMVDPYQNKKWSYHNVYGYSRDYKRYLRFIKDNNVPDLIPIFKKLVSGPALVEFSKMDIADYSKCKDFLEMHTK